MLIFMLAYLHAYVYDTQLHSNEARFLKGLDDHGQTYQLSRSQVLVKLIFQVDKAKLAEFSKLQIQITCFSALTASEDCIVPVLQGVATLMHMYLNSSDTVFALCKWHIQNIMYHDTHNYYPP